MSFSSSTSKKVASNTIYQLIGKVVSMSITILTTVIVTRAYGREGFGEFNLMQNFPALFFIIVDFGINAIATREISQDWEKSVKYFVNVLFLRVVISILFILFCIISLQFFPYSVLLKFGIYLSLFLILTQALFTTTNIIFQAKLRYDLSTIGYIFGSILILIFVLIFTVLKLPVYLVNFSYVIGGIGAFLINLFFVRKVLKESGKDLIISKDLIDIDLIKLLLVQTLPLGLMFIFSQINFKADSILISIMRLPSEYNLNNTESVAIYGLPYKIFEVSLVVPTFFMNAAYPILVRHMMEGKIKLKNTFFKSITILAGMGISASILGIILAPLAVEILGGSQFSQSVEVLKILFLGLVVFYLTQPLSWLIVTLGRQKFLPYIYLVSAVFNVSANIYFIPRYSFYASSVITWISELLILFMLLFFTHKAWKEKYA